MAPYGYRLQRRVQANHEYRTLIKASEVYFKNYKNLHLCKSEYKRKLIPDENTMVLISP